MPPREPNCTCKTCGARFYAKPSQIRLRNGGQHCSRACKYADPASFKRGEEHPNWKGGDARTETRRGRAQRTYALGECERCGAAATDRHHIDGDTNNNAPENIERLCRRCHMEADGRLERFNAARPKKLTPELVEEIRAAMTALERPGRRRPKGSVKALAERYGVSTGTLKSIANGTRWPA